MTNEQATKIATVVWGWDDLKGMYSDDRSEHTRYLPECVEWEMNYSFDEWIVELVKSWQGYGRTWDFFRDKYSHYVTIDFCWHEDAQSWACNVGVDTNYSFSGYGETQFEAIHNAALEACEKGNNK